MGRTTTKKQEQSQDIKVTVRGEELNMERIVEVTGFSESTVESLWQTTPHALQDMIETKFQEAETRKRAEEAEKAKAKTPKRIQKTDRDKNLNKLRKFLKGTEATPTSQIMAEVAMAPWRGAKDIKMEIDPDASRTYSTPVHDAKLMLSVLMELELLDGAYVAELKELAAND